MTPQSPAPRYLPQAEFGSDFIHHLGFWVFKKLQAVLCSNLSGIEGERVQRSGSEERGPPAPPWLRCHKGALGAPGLEEGGSSGENARPPENTHTAQAASTRPSAACASEHEDPMPQLSRQHGLSGLRRALHGVKVLCGEEASFKALLINRFTLAGSHPACWPGPSCLQEVMLGWP